jgi:hypothetical protein
VRFVWAVAAFVLAAVMIVAGIAERTIFEGPKTATATISTTQEAPYLLIHGAVLNKVPGVQTLRAQADGEIFASYGRTADMQAWLADVPYNDVSLNAKGHLVTKNIQPKMDAGSGTNGSGTTSGSGDSGGDGGSGDGGASTAQPAQSPVGSDLWLGEFQQKNDLIAPLQLPKDMSVLVATDGVKAAPSHVAISWPIASATPWAGPLFVGGAILMAVGVLLYILGIRNARRSRGPRRKGLPLPVTEPIDLAVQGADKGVISATPPTRRAVSSGRRAFTIVPVVAVSALLFTGCSADSWPQFGQSPTPTPTATVVTPEGQQAPAVTKAQAERIIARVAATAAKADQNMDQSLAATRLDGTVLATRATNYSLRGAIKGYKAPAPIVTSPLKIVLPQAYDGWPRSMMAVVDDQKSKTSSIMVLTQADPWSPYKLSYDGSLEASTNMPDLAPTYIGATQVPPDSSFLVMQPKDLAKNYADVINNGEKSQYYSMFETDGDHLRESITADRQKRLAEFMKTAAKTGSLTFTSAPGANPPFALATLESGAIVAVNLNETDIVRPTNKDAVIKLQNNPTVKTLAGVAQSATGFSTTFTDQVFFYVPGQGSSEKIRLLGYSSDILDAKVIK